MYLYLLVYPYFQRAARIGIAGLGAPRLIREQHEQQSIFAHCRRKPAQEASQCLGHHSLPPIAVNLPEGSRSHDIA